MKNYFRERLCTSGPETPSGSEASFVCHNNPDLTVKRECSDGGQWGEFDQQSCAVYAVAEQLRVLNVASENV